MSGDKAKKTTKKPAKKAKTTEKKKATKTASKTTKKDAKPKAETVVKKDSLIYVDYVGRTKDDGRIFDLTLEEVAKEEGLFREDDRYEPILVAVGSNWLLEAIEEELIGMKVNETPTRGSPRGRPPSR